MRMAGAGLRREPVLLRKRRLSDSWVNLRVWYCSGNPEVKTNYCVPELYAQQLVKGAGVRG
jgi:hypothetical protein